MVISSGAHRCQRNAAAALTNGGSRPATKSSSGGGDVGVLVVSVRWFVFGGLWSAFWHVSRTRGPTVFRGTGIACVKIGGLMVCLTTHEFMRRSLTASGQKENQASHANEVAG